MTVRAAATASITVDGVRIDAVPGIPLGAVLHERDIGQLFCGMGVCFVCLVTVDGRPGVRACLEPVRDAMRVERA